MSFDAKLDRIIARHSEVESLLSSGGLASDDFADLSREYNDLSSIKNLATAYRAARQQLEEAKALMADPDLGDMAEEDYYRLKETLPALEQAVKMALLPRDPADGRNAIVEIRAGTGGDEAALFAGDLFNMYQHFAAEKSWRFEVLEKAENDLGGIKQAVVAIKGDGVFGRLKYESGVHRVQRVPTTEAGGRIHTSAATVAVLPEAQEVDVRIEDKDLRIDTYRAGGAGGQHVNKTDSAVRITHIPTGIVVAQQDEKSQHKNKARAMMILRARLYEFERQKIDSLRAENRRSQVGSGDRSERIRTYNFPQGRVTDHRINLTLYKLDRVLSGECLDEIIDPLIFEEQSALMTEASW